MKNFDLEAAKRGAAVCRGAGFPLNFHTSQIVPTCLLGCLFMATLKNCIPKLVLILKTDKCTLILQVRTT